MERYFIVFIFIIFFFKVFCYVFVVENFVNIVFEKYLDEKIREVLILLCWFYGVYGIIINFGEFI